MNRGSNSFNRSIAAAAMTGALFLSGCMTTTVVPNGVPLQKGNQPHDVGGDTLEVMSGSRESAPYEILMPSGLDLGFTTSRQAWSRRLADTLAGELARRGASLRVNAGLKLKVSVESITLAQSREIYGFTVKVRDSTSTGWSKEYEASAETRINAFEFMDHLSRRLAGQALANVIKAMVEDPEFLSQIRKREAQTTAPAPESSTRKSSHETAHPKNKKNRS